MVEFFVETGEDGRMKAVKVTGPDGAPPQARTFALHSIPLLKYMLAPAMPCFEQDRPVIGPQRRSI